MAILIDMPMPHDCGECVFMVDGWCYCIKAEDWQSRKVEFEDRPEWCPMREVVFCRWCKWSESDPDDWQDAYICHNRTHNQAYGTKSHGFCAWGERREE